MKRGRALGGSLLPIMLAPGLAWAHHAGGPSDGGVGLVWLLLGGSVVALLGIAGWALLAPGGDGGEGKAADGRRDS